MTLNFFSTLGFLVGGGRGSKPTCSLSSTLSSQFFACHCKTWLRWLWTASRASYTRVITNHWDCHRIRPANTYMGLRAAFARNRVTRESR